MIHLLAGRRAHWGYFAVLPTFGDFGCIMKIFQINVPFLVLLMILLDLTLLFTVPSEF